MCSSSAILSAAWSRCTKTYWRSSSQPTSRSDRRAGTSSVLQTLRPCLEARARGRRQQQLRALRHKRGVAAGCRACHDLVIQLPVTRLQEALEQQAGRDEVLGTPHGKCKVDGPVAQIVAAHGCTRLVGAHAAHERGHICVIGAALMIRAAPQRHDVVAALLDEAADDALDAVADKVAAHLVGLLFGRHQLAARHAIEVAR
eukprot:366228-Chlamydomonas_euryale.AAC.33